MTQVFDIAIIGAGPAGISAAVTCATAGASTVVLDEQAAPGGQIWRRAPAALAAGSEKFGGPYRKGVDYATQAFNRPDITWRSGQGVWGVLRPQTATDPVFRLLLTGNAGWSETHARQVIIATGCYDMPVPFPGWTLPGVMGGGAIQAMMKGQRVLPGDDVILAGSHPLLLIVANQMLAFGVVPKRIVFSQPMTCALRLLRNPPVLAAMTKPLIEAMGAFRNLRRAGVPMVFNQAVIAAKGDGQLAAVRIARVDRRSGTPDPSTAYEVACDTLGVSFGFTASSELARQMGAKVNWSENGGGWIVSHDGAMRSAIPGLLVAGEVTGIGGAETARVEGALAAMSALSDAGFSVSELLRQKTVRHRQRLRSRARMLAMLSDPGADLLDALCDDQTAICRCESVRKDQVMGMLRDNPDIGSSDALKLLGRVGMGPCQGRYCGQVLLRLMTAERGMAPQAIGPYAARMPVKPVALHHFLK